MTYEQKLTKIGNSVGIIFPKQLLEKLNLKEGNTLFIQEMNDKVIIEKDSSSSVSPEFLKIAENVGERYTQAFEDLS